MASLSTKTLKTLIVLLLPILLILGPVRLLVTDAYLAYEYGKADFPPDPYGFDREQRHALALANFRYVREAEPLEALAGQSLNGTPVYNSRELKHMQDVQDVYQAVWLAWKIAAGLVLLAGLALAWKDETRPALAGGLRTGGLLAAGLIGAIGLLAVLAWRAWFVAFHQVFFAPGSWTFLYTDTLIRLFPEKFWFDAALTIAGLGLAGGLLVALVGWRLQVRAGPTPGPVALSGQGRGA